MRTAFVTMADSKFLIGCDVLVYSIEKNSPGFFEKCDAKILLALDKDIKSFRDFDIIYVDPSKYKYCRISRAAVSPSKLFLFTLTQFDKIIFYEADTVCVGNINELHSNKLEKYDFAACRIYYESSKAPRTYNGKNIFLGDGWVVNKRLLTGKFYDELISCAENKSNCRGEQEIITHTLEDHHYNTRTLSPIFDVISFIDNSTIEPYSTYFNDARIYHITSKSKPWILIGNYTKPSKKMVEKWMSIYNEKINAV